MKKLFSMQAIALVATLFSFSQINAQNWLLAGNAPANANSFVGTTNAQMLRFRTNNVERMVMLTDGKIGIGTAAPTARFQVDNATFGTAGLVNQTFNSNSQAVGFQVDCTNNGTGAERAGYFRARGTLGANMGLWAVAENGGTNYAFYGDARTATAGGSSYGAWASAASVAGTTAYAVYGETTGAGTNWAGFFNGRAHVSGRLGVGTTGPNSMFHVAGPAGDDALNVTINGAGKLQVRSNGGLNVGSGVSVPPANGLYVYGATGIGTASPLAKLHVVGDVNNETVVFRTSDDVTRFKITSNGGVSIGTTHTATPNGLIVGDKVLINCLDNAATAGYMLAVNGKAICEEMRVKLSGNWPDYVFSSDYRLPKLAEIEAFISENGHLPGIPSAAVVEKNGHDVGEMNRLLLEKVEQLTLHLIALEKELSSLKK